MLDASNPLDVATAIRWCESRLAGATMPGARRGFQVRVTYATGGSGDVSLLLDDGAKIYRRPPVKEGT